VPDNVKILENDLTTAIAELKESTVDTSQKLAIFPAKVNTDILVADTSQVGETDRQLQERQWEEINVKREKIIKERFGGDINKAKEFAKKRSQDAEHERDLYYQNRDEIVKNYKGKYILTQGGKVIFSSDNNNETLEKVACMKAPIFHTRAGQEEGVSEFVDLR